MKKLPKRQKEKVREYAVQVCGNKVFVSRIKDDCVFTSAIEVPPDELATFLLSDGKHYDEQEEAFDRRLDEYFWRPEAGLKRQWLRKQRASRRAAH